MTHVPGQANPRPDAGCAPAGSLADAVAAAPPAPAWRAAFGPGARLRLAVLAGLLVWLNWGQFHWLAERWKDPNWMHGYIIPLFSLYLLYNRRADLLATPRRVSLWGLALLVLAVLGEFLCIYPVQNYWLSQICMVFALLGLVWYLAGWAVVRVVWLPILFLLFALPLPDSLYSAIALPLQNVAAKGALVVLRLFGVGITATASALEVINQNGVARQLTVAEACSGIRLLMAFLALGVAMAYLDDKPPWQRVVLVVMGVPIAIFCNVLRVSITCAMYYFDKEELGQGFMHSFTGILMLVPAFALLWGLAWILAWFQRNLYVEAEAAGAGDSEAQA